MVCFACNADTVEVDGARTVCTRCGTVLEENAIVSEITFGETGGGAAIVQGSYVGADQTRARAPAGYRNAGGRQESREQTMLNGRRRIQELAVGLHIPERLADAGQRYFNLAVNINFVQGRRTLYVVAACLYCACRMDKTSHMLIDFSDLLQINVFVLGSTYLKLVKELQLQLPTVDPSLYISRFAALLEFGEETQKVAQDAVRLVARMGRDWMHIGRRPAGVCGACLLLAARMNNFRRSIAEVVQVVKIADTTLKKRLEEFRETPSGALTVADFRTLWLDETADPPAFLKSLEREKEERESIRKKREQTLANQAGLAAPPNADDDDDGTERIAKGKARSSDQDDDGSGTIPKSSAEPEASSMPPPPVPSKIASGKRRRLDEDRAATTKTGDSEEENDEQGNDDDADREGEEDDEEPNPLMDDNGPLDEAITDELASTLGSRAGIALTDELDKAEARRIRLASAMTNINTSQQHSIKEGSQELSSLERLDDLDEDELDAFILSKEEVQAKSRLWMQMNKEYLQQLADKQTGPDGEVKPAAARRMRKRHRPRDSQNAVGVNAAESTKQLLAKKRFSKKINYAAVDALFGGKGGSGQGDDDEDEDAASSVGGRRDGNDTGYSSREGSTAEFVDRSYVPSNQASRAQTPSHRIGTPIRTPAPTFGSRRASPAAFSRAGSEQLPQPVGRKQNKVAIETREVEEEDDNNDDDEEEAAAGDDDEDDSNAEWRKMQMAGREEDDGFADAWA